MNSTETFSLTTTHQTTRLLKALGQADDNRAITLRASTTGLVYEATSIDGCLIEVREPGENQLENEIVFSLSARILDMLPQAYDLPVPGRLPDDQTLVIEIDDSLQEISCERSYPAGFDKGNAQASTVATAALISTLDFLLPFARSSQNHSHKIEFREQFAMTGDADLFGVVELRDTPTMNFAIDRSVAGRLRRVLAVMPSLIHITVSETTIELSCDNCWLSLPTTGASFPDPQRLLAQAPTQAVAVSHDRILRSSIFHNMLLRPHRRDRGSIRLTYDSNKPDSIQVRAQNLTAPSGLSSATWETAESPNAKSWALSVDLADLLKASKFDGASLVTLAPVGECRALHLGMETSTLQCHVYLRALEPAYGAA